MQFQRFLRKSHKVLSIIVFIQLLFWMLSGLYMTAVPLTKVHGDHLAERQGLPPIQPQTLIPLNTVLTTYPTTHTITYFTRIDGVPVFELVGAVAPDANEHAKDEQTVYLNGATGERLAGLDENQVRQFVTQIYTGQGQLSQLVRLEDTSTISEIRGRQGPVWQAQFDNGLSDTIYINANTGQITAVRSDLWRWFDFLWMLHIMDYDTRDNFNNPLVILMASLGLLVTLSGTLMLTSGLKKHGWRFLK